jgi:hypothetical protein
MFVNGTLPQNAFGVHSLGITDFVTWSASSCTNCYASSENFDSEGEDLVNPGLFLPVIRPCRACYSDIRKRSRYEGTKSGSDSPGNVNAYTLNFV